MPRPQRPQISFVAQPVEGAPGAANSAAVVVIGVPRLRFALIDAAGARVGKAYLVTPSQGRATWKFTNPATGAGYRVTSEDEARQIRAVRSAAFDVVAAQPAPQPIPTPQPQPIPQPQPQPQPQPNPIPPPAVLSVLAASPPQVGKPCRLTVQVAGIAKCEWTAVQDVQGWPWIGTLGSGTPDAAGRFSFDWTPTTPNEFVKVMALGDRVRFKDGPKATGAPVPSPSPSPDPAPIPAPVPAGDGAFARAWRDSLLQGVNIERWRGCYMSFQGNPLARSTAYYLYLKAGGITHVRWFFPWHNDADMLGDGITLRSGRRPSIDKMREFLQPLKQCARAGLKNHVDFVDVASWDVLGEQWGNVQAHIADLARLIAEDPDLGPNTTMVGPYNELIRWQSSNAQYNKLRMDAHGIIRNILSRHIICHGSDDWDNWPALTANDWQAPPDKLSMGQWHGYVGADIGQGGLREIQAAMDAFEARHGIPSYCGEFGDDFDHSRVGNDDRWLRLMNDAARVAPRIKPAWWAVSDGQEFPLNDRDDPTIRPQLYEGFRANASLFKTA